MPTEQVATDQLKSGDIVYGSPRAAGMGTAVSVWDVHDATILPGAAVWLRSLRKRDDGTAYSPYAVNVGWDDLWTREVLD